MRSRLGGSTGGFNIKNAHEIPNASDVSYKISLQDVGHTHFYLLCSYFILACNSTIMNGIEESNRRVEFDIGVSSVSVSSV